jgi:hypothetical protein
MTRILVVEDEPTIAIALQDDLARISHKPIAKSRRIWHNCVSTQAVTDQTKRLSL